MHSLGASSGVHNELTQAKYPFRAHEPCPQRMRRDGPQYPLRVWDIPGIQERPHGRRVESQESLNNCGIELASGAKFQLSDCFVHRTRAAVRATISNDHKGVRHANDPRTNGDFPSSQTIRIAGAIEFLMVMTHDVGDIPEMFVRRQ